MVNKKKLFLFDLNGTLVNDNDLWYKSISEVFIKNDKKPPTVSEYFEALEDGDWRKVYSAKGINATPEELNSVYIPTYKSGMHEPKLFSGEVRLILSVLYSNKEKYNLGLITAQPEELVTPVMDRLGINIIFDRDFVSVNNINKHLTINDFVAKSGCSREDTFYVGDTPSDIKHGKKAGVKTVAFLNGFIPEELVLNKEPDFAIRSFVELLEIM